MSEDICVTINDLGGVTTEIETPDVEVNFLKSAIYTDPSAIIYNTDKFANAITGKVEDWDGTGILLDDVSPLGEVTVTNNFIDEMTVTSCGKNLAVINTIQYTELNKDAVIFEGPVIGDFVFNYMKKLTGVTGSGAQMMSIVANGETKNVTYNGTSLHYITGTLERITFNRTAMAATGGAINEIQLEVGTSKTNSEPYKQGETVVIEGYGTGKLKPISPNMTLYSDAPDGDYRIDYNKDTNVVINKLTQAIIALGGNI